jgi:hypothetical protein
VIFLSAGHYPMARGASWKGFIEHDEAIEWLWRMAKFIPRAQIVPTGRLSQKIAWINARAKPGDLALEIHFNAAHGNRGEGSETLYRAGSAAGEAAARAVQDTIAPFFLPDRGIKPRTDLAFLNGTRCAAVIIEPEFVYHADKIRERRTTVCGALALTLEEIA